MTDASNQTPEPTRPLLVLLHGLGEWPTAWQPQLDALPPDWQITAPWLRGLKPTAKVPFELVAASSEIAGLPQQHGVERMHVVADGLGALVALHLAAEAPELVDRLVVSSPPMTPPKWALRMQGAALRLTSDRKLASKGLSKERILSANREVAELDLAGRLSAVTASTLVVAGESDRTGLTAARLVASRVPDARLETLPGGATLHTSHPEQFNRLAVAFLTEGPAGGDSTGTGQTGE